MTSEAKATKEDTTNSVKGQATEGKEIFTNHVSGKGLISRIYLKIPVTQQQNKPNQKWAKNLNRHFSIKDMQAANKHIEGCSASLIIKQTQLKTTVRCHLTPTRVAAIRTENKCGEMTTLVLCWWKCKMVPLLWKTVWQSFKNYADCHRIQQFSFAKCKQIFEQTVVLPYLQQHHSQ